MSLGQSLSLRSPIALIVAVCIAGRSATAQKAVGPLPAPSAATTEPSIAKCDQEAVTNYDASYTAARDSVTKGQLKTLDYPAILKHRQAVLHACVQALDASKYQGEYLLQLARKYAEVGEHDAAGRAFKRYFEAPGIADSTRARALMTMIGHYAKSARQQMQYGEAYVDQLEAAPGVSFKMKLAAHEMLFSGYQEWDIDLGSQKHALAVIKLARNAKAEIRSNEHPEISAASVDASELLTMYQAAANVDGNFGHEANAIKLLEQARHDHPEIPAAIMDSGLSATISRLKLTGKLATAVESQHWFTAPEGMRTTNFVGNVTVLAFTAHWCPPCQATYVPFRAMSDSLASRGARFMFVTTYYGFVGNKRGLTAAQEREETRRYYASKNITFPVAMLGDGFDPVKFEQRDMPPPFASYFLEQIPQSVIIDRHGKIRRIIVGWDPANGERLPALLNALLREK